MPKYMIYYLIFINSFSFIVYGLDKFFAKKNIWRISEMFLICTSIIGGVIGSMCAMLLFKHKNSKPKFYLTVSILTIIYFFVGILLLLK